MIFIETELEGAYLIELEKLEDERGFFARSWDTKKFEEHGLNPKLVQCNISFSKRKGTLRGIHYQITPYEETKLVRCTKGKIFDVIIDLRKKSKTYKKWEGFILSEDNHKMIFVPESFAHGIQTLEDNTEVLYQVAQFYSPKAERGIRWNDPFFKIKWPLTPTVISKKDSKYHDFIS